MDIELFRSFFGKFAAPMAVATPSADMVEVNDAFCHLLGYSRSELLNLTVFDYTHPGDVDRSRHFFELVDSGKVDHFHYEKRYIRKDGSVIWAVVSTSWHPTDKSETALCVAVIQDISTRVAAQQTCQRSEELLSTLMDNIDLGITLVDENKNILALNRTQAEMFRKKPSDFIGKKCYSELEKRESACLHCPGAHVLKDGQPHTMETEGVLDDGSRFLVKIRTLPIPASDGEVRKFIQIAEDITKTREIEHELKQSQDQLNYLAHHDQLTGLPNRTLFYDRIKHGLDQSRRNLEGMAVVVFNIDRFKKVIESLGFEKGNQAIEAVSRRLKTHLRASDSLSHIGGTAFGMVLQNTGGMQTSAKIADRILYAFDELFVIPGRQLHLTPSIGISHYPEDGEDVETLLLAAESARSKANEKGGNGYEYYQPKMGDQARKFLELESLLYTALSQDQFEPFYQPQIDPATGRVIGLEALARWRHPERGLVSPADFIPVAEKTGLIIPLGQRMLEMVCRQTQEWLPRLPANFRMAVNISPLQIARTDPGQLVSAVLKGTGLPSTLLEIEITESALINDPDKALKALNALKERGVKVALDDFGTGYSAMSYLKKFPIDRLKIDRTFVAALPDGTHEAAIVETVFALAQRLGIEVVAEGVETTEQLNYLLDLGCRAVQGFYFSRPLDMKTVDLSLGQWFGSQQSSPFMR